MIEVHFAQTPNSAKVLIALRELGMEYSIKRYDLYQGEHHSAEFRALNPNVKIPVIVDHDPADAGEPIPVFETAAILTYLAEKGGALIPSDPRRRIEALQWLAWQVSGLGPYMGQAAHFIRYAPPGPHEYSTKRYVNESIRLLHVMDYQLQREEYLAGEEYSIADIACFPIIHYFDAYFEFDFLSIDTVKRWHAAILERPAVQAVINGPEMDPGRYYDASPVLSEDEWSNVFGEKMLKASMDTSK